MEKEKEKIVEFFEKHSWLEKILKLLSWFSSVKDRIDLILRNLWINWMNKFIDYFTVKRDKVKNKVQDVNEFYDLCAVDTEEDKKCGDLLKWGIENRKVNNIAVTGPYGAGKTSFLRSFENNHKEYKYLNISLASFKEDENNEKKIEENILQQILYKVNGSKMPFSRIKRIKELSLRNFLVSSLFLYLWVSLLYYLHPMDKLKPFKQLFLIKFQEDPRAKLNMTLVFIVATLFLVYKALNLVKSFNIKIKAFDSEVQLSSNDEASIFYMHLDEILYFFKKTKYDVVYFEDIDRFEKINLDLFTKLRELNGLLNQSEDIKRPINFVYAVKDDLFVEKWVEEKKSTKENKNSDKLRTKFFDLIIPIIPVINVSNSSDIFCKRLKEIIKKEKHKELTKRVNDFSLYIDDMRLLNNIYNEFVVYRANLEDKESTEQIDDIKLLGFMVYKNKYPKDFSELHFNEGKVFDIFKRKTEILIPITNELNNELKVLENLIEKCSSEKLDSLEDLRMKTLNYLVKFYPSAIKFGDYLIGNLINDENAFLKVINATSLSYDYLSRGYSQSNQCNTEHLPVNKKIGFSYEERKQLIERKIANKIIDLKNRHTDLRLEIDNINKKSLRDLISQYDLDIIKTEENKNDDLILYLIKEGIIDEKTYHLFISYFYEGNLTNLDRELLISIKNEKELPYDFTSDHIKEVIERLYVENFNKKYILNYSLVEYILINNEKYSSEFNTLIKFMIEDLENLDEYLNGFFVNIVNSSKILKILVKKIKILFKVICINPDTYEIKSKKNILDILIYGDINDIVELNIDDTVSNFLYNSEYSFSLLKEFSEINLSKFKELLKRLNIKLKYLNPTENSEAFEYIYNNNLYDISIDNIENITKVVCEDSEIVISDLRDRNYTTIKNTDTLKPLYNYTADKFLNYIEDVFLAITTNINEDEKAILEILNVDEEFLGLEDKKKVIEKQECIYKDISKIDNKELWENVFDKFKIQPTWGNVLHYFVHKEEKIDEVLLKFFNNIEFSEELSKEKIYNEKFDEKVLEKLSEEIMDNENINSSPFKKLTLSLYNYSSFGMINTSESRIDDIIECGKLNLTIDIVTELKKNFPEKVLKFLLSKLDLFLDKLNDYKEVIDIEDYENVFISDIISEEQKVKFINNFDLSLLDKKESLFNEFKEFLRKLELLNYFNEEQLIRLNTSNLLPVSNEIILKLREVDENNESSELEKFIENNYTEILKSLKDFDFNEAELTILFQHIKETQELQNFLDNFNNSLLSKNSKLVNSLQKEIDDTIKIEMTLLINIIKNLNSVDLMIELLTKRIAMLSHKEIKKIFKILPSPFNELAKNQQQVLIPISEINEAFILELEKFDIVASFKEDNSHDDVYRIWLKKDFYFYSEPL